MLIHFCAFFRQARCKQLLGLSQLSLSFVLAPQAQQHLSADQMHVMILRRILHGDV